MIGPEQFSNELAYHICSATAFRKSSLCRKLLYFLHEHAPSKIGNEHLCEYWIANMCEKC